ncbi:hypothetical protein BU16DRAFT_621110 [Lophium mytilinum]|uniref:Uncharacterized protein n=1 Tax=Lophium mytilinum TaxID=390894 RepID=A0A6A6QGM9_9PEZI|nr:hypothetical protein BU16DRAFT_621110 [Lophium mytilinum]
MHGPKRALFEAPGEAECDAVEFDDSNGLVRQRVESGRPLTDFVSSPSPHSGQSGRATMPDAMPQRVHILNTAMGEKSFPHSRGCYPLAVLGQSRELSRRAQGLIEANGVHDGAVGCDGKEEVWPRWQLASSRHKERHRSGSSSAVDLGWLRPFDIWRRALSSHARPSLLHNNGEGVSGALSQHVGPRRKQRGQRNAASAQNSETLVTMAVTMADARAVEKGARSAAMLERTHVGCEGTEDAVRVCDRQRGKLQKVPVPDSSRRRQRRPGPAG